MNWIDINCQHPLVEGKYFVVKESPSTPNVTIAIEDWVEVFVIKYKNDKKTVKRKFMFSNTAHESQTITYWMKIPIFYRCNRSQLPEPLDQRKFITMIGQ